MMSSGWMSRRFMRTASGGGERGECASQRIRDARFDEMDATSGAARLVSKAKLSSCVGIKKEVSTCSLEITLPCQHRHLSASFCPPHFNTFHHLILINK